jgi:hypothetical protein
MQDLLVQYQNIARMILGHSQIYGAFLPYGQTYSAKKPTVNAPVYSL